VIPEAAVEAAARAMYAQDGGVGEFSLWVYQDYAKAMLEAAAPHMLAECWQSAYEQGVSDEGTAAALDMPEYGPNRSNPHRSA